MDFIWILFAFICGLAVKLVSLPPLIGYLFAGFFLHFVGIEPDDSLETLADIGITLMLFTIGLKLEVKSLLKREIWAGAITHMGLWILVALGITLGLGALAVPYFSELSFENAALLAFMLSFSSTVCVVKLLEESGEMKTRHGKLAIGILVMQDLIAVLFIAFATGKEPSIWAIALLGLLLIPPVVNFLLDKAGHGELLPLAGFFLALGGYELFELVGIKGDLGALLLGAVLSGSDKASELSKNLLHFKDLFLIGFFLSIGFTALPDGQMLGAALILALLLPLKFAMFFGIFTTLRLRGRTAFLGSLALTNISEFGLIVAALGVKLGWIEEHWLVIISLAVSISFVFTSIFYKRAHEIYMKNKRRIKQYESAKRLPDDQMFQPQSAEIIVIGLGRVGLGAYCALESMVGDRVWGMDADRERVDRLREKYDHVFSGDGEDADLWEELDLSSIKLILLALPSIEDSENIMLQINNGDYQGKVAAIARYNDEHEQLLDAGVDKVFNFFTEAGLGFAEESLLMVETNSKQEAVAAS
ncbi:MAG: cation:proton antiporter [Pseudomonadales bacterium]|nr:cation:proton antiporter [Pseudomonadales bacterium]